MKYYSETLKKLFESEDELVAAEERAEKLNKEEQEKKNKISALKKIAATKVEVAVKAYEKAADAYEKKKTEVLEILDKAEQEAADIINEANKEAEKQLQLANDEFKKAKKAKFDAVAEFNKSYGPFKTTITNEQVEKEYDRFISDLDNWMNKLYKLI